MDATFENLTGDNFACSKLISKLWREQQSVLLIEQDVLPTPELLLDMWSCNHDWCAGWYWQGPDKVTALACNKFSASRLRQCPHAVGSSDYPLQWTQIDLALLPQLRGCGFNAHQHDPPVLHLH